jgi:serine/threonine-protein kinase HipA
MIDKNKILLELFEKELQLTKKDIEEKTNIKGSTLNNILKILVESNKIQRIGKAKATYYKRVYNERFTYKNITVLKDGIVVGELSFGDGNYYFTYSNSYKGRELIGLKNDKTTHQSNQLFSVFENLIPESHRREKHIDISKYEDLADSLTTLLQTHGSYEFVYTYELYKYKKTNDKRPAWVTVKNKILGEYSYPNILNFTLDIPNEILDDKTNRDYSSLSGYQNKIDVTIDTIKNLVAIDTNNAKYLLKPFNKNIGEYFGDKKAYYPQVLVNEHLFMSFAKNELGFDVPYNGLIYHNNQFHYIIKRFDRYEDWRYEQYDFGQFLNISSSNKYNVSSDVVFAKANEILEEKASKMKMLKFYFYAYIIQHSDLHAKNLAALNIGKDNYIFSPLYDVISLGVIKGKSIDDLALPIQRIHQNKKSKFTIDDFLYLANFLELNHLDVKKEFRKILVIFIQKFPDYIEKTKELLTLDELTINKSRVKKTNLIDKLHNFYSERLIALKKAAILEALEITK